MEGEASLSGVLNRFRRPWESGHKFVNPMHLEEVKLELVLCVLRMRSLSSFSPVPQGHSIYLRVERHSDYYIYHMKKNM